MAIAEAEMESIVRTVTDEEVEHYHEFGWVMMRGLVEPAFAAHLLQSALDLGQAAGRELVDNQPALRGDEPFHSLMFSRRMANNATRLANRRRLKGVDVPMRYREDFLIKKPAGQPHAPRPLDTPAGYHPEYGTGFHQVILPLPRPLPRPLSIGPSQPSLTTPARRTRASTDPTASASCSSGWR